MSGSLDHDFPQEAFTPGRSPRRAGRGKVSGGHKAAQHVRQDAAVLVILGFDRGVHAQQELDPTAA